MTEKEKSEIQFETFWKSIKLPGDWITFSIPDLQYNFKFVWDKSREVMRSSMGSASGDCKRRPKEQYKAMAKKRWDKEKQKKGGPK